MTPSSDCGADAAAYVLGALEPREAERFRNHLDRCIVCRDEVTALQTVADALPMAAPPVELPKALRKRIVETAREEQRAAGQRRPRAAPAWPGAFALRPAAIGAAVLAVAGGAFAVVEVAGGGGSANRTVRAQVLASAGSAYLKVGNGHAVLVVDHMPAPPLNKIYEVWLKRRDQAPQPTAALFNVTANGSGEVDVPSDLDGVAQVLVTPEPLGGSAVPTHAPVIEATLT